MVWLSIKQGMGEIEDWTAIRRAARMRRRQEKEGRTVWAGRQEEDARHGKVLPIGAGGGPRFGWNGLMSKGGGPFHRRCMPPTRRRSSRPIARLGAFRAGSG